MRKSLLLIFALFVFTAKSQVLKTYTGSYENGTATYQYYENSNYERIYQGSFRYKNGSTSLIVGQYKNNKKSGTWKLTYHGSMPFDYRDLNTEEITANYKDGKLNGMCTEKEINIKTKKIIKKSSANFVNNILVGKYEYYSKKNSININFSTDSSGRYNGDYYVSYTEGNAKYEDIRKYKNGQLYFRLYRNAHSGEILQRLGSEQPTITNDNYNYPAWDVPFGLNFWFCDSKNDCQYCGCSRNLLYTIKYGTDFDNISENEYSFDNPYYFSKFSSANILTENKEK